jgi:hypothetical protein
MKELNIDILKKYADLGFLTDTSIINACELQPELLKTINVYDYVSVTDLGNIDMVKSAPIEVDLNNVDNVTPIEPIEVEPTTTEVDDVKEPEIIEGIEPFTEPVAEPVTELVAPEIPEIVVEEKEVETEPVKSVKTKKK